MALSMTLSRRCLCHCALCPGVLPTYGIPADLAHPAVAAKQAGVGGSTLAPADPAADPAANAASATLAVAAAAAAALAARSAPQRQAAALHGRVRRRPQAAHRGRYHR